jgi:hypothetical protein
MNETLSKSATCHLLRNKEIDFHVLQNSLEQIDLLTDTSHFFRSLRTCKTCGQLFFFEFLEFIDWVKGDDPQYCMWIPVYFVFQAYLLNSLSSFQLLSFSGFRFDSKSGSEQVFWKDVPGDGYRLHFPHLK